jgi:hypothetical protein
MSVVTELPGLEQANGQLLVMAAGELEQAVTAQVDELTRQGYIEPRHAAQVKLAQVTARDIDRSWGRGAPSGRANLLRVMNEILALLPQPVAASTDKLDDIVALLRGDQLDPDPLMQGTGE